MATNGNNGNISYSPNPTQESGVFGYMRGQSERSNFTSKYWNEDNGYLSKSIKELEQMKSTYAEMAKLSDKMTKAEKTALREKRRELEQQLSLLYSYQQVSDVTDKEAIESIKSSNKLRLQGLTQYQKLLSRLSEEEIENAEEYKKIMDEVQENYSRMKKDAAEVNAELERSSKVLNKSTDSFSDALSKTLSNAGDTLSKLSNMFNLERLANNAMEQNARSKAAIMGDASRQFGFTNNSQFEAFKNSLNDTLKDMNKEMGNIFNSSDLKEYMANLSTYGITDTKLAQQQMKSSIIAQKYLGTSAETQTEIFKYMKRTDNTEAMNDHNKMIVGIMKSQLNVSKDQLDQLAKIAYVSATDLAAVGMTAEAQKAYIPTTTAIGAALTNLTGNEATGRTIQQMYANFLNAKADELGNWAPILGSTNMVALQNKAFTASTNEGQLEAFMEFMRAIQSSSAFSGNQLNQKYIASLIPGYDSTAMLGIKNTDLSKFMSVVQTELENISNTTEDDITKLIEKTQEATFLEQISNKLDVFFNGLPWKTTMTLANSAFMLYLGSGLVKGLGNFISGFKTGGLKAGLQSMFSGGAGGTDLAVGTSKLAAFLTNPVTLAGVITTGVIAGANAWNNKMGEGINNKAIEDFKNSDSKYANNSSAQAIRGLTAEHGNQEGRTGFGKFIGNLGDTGAAIWLGLKKTGTWFSNLGVSDAYKKNSDFISQNRLFYESMLASSIKAKGQEADLYTLAFAYLLDEVGSLESLTGVSKSYLKQYIKNGDFAKDNIQAKMEELIEAGWSPSGENMKKATGKNTIDRYAMNGLPWVPKDNFRALLHKGEMVLTADEARVYRNVMNMGGTSSLKYSEPNSQRDITSFPYRITSGWHEKRTRNNGTTYYHSGVDFGIPGGTPIGASQAGTVYQAYYNSSYGNLAVVRDKSGKYHYYAHMKQKASVKPGDEIGIGTLIGYVGNTGESKGNHLHYEVRPSSNKWADNINPLPFVTQGLFNAGTASYNVSGDTSSTTSGTSSVPVQSTKFIPKAFQHGTGGSDGSSERIVNSVDNGFDKLINYLNNIREEQAAQREIINAFSKTRTSQPMF